MGRKGSVTARNTLLPTRVTPPNLVVLYTGQTLQALLRRSALEKFDPSISDL